MNKSMANPLQQAYLAYEALSGQGANLDSFDTFVEAMKTHKDFGSVFGESEVRAIYWWLREHNLIHETEGAMALVAA